jgi:hypothetical protein
MVGCSGLWTRNMIAVHPLLHENVPWREIHNRWNNRKGIKGKREERK